MGGPGQAGDPTGSFTTVVAQVVDSIRRRERPNEVVDRRAFVRNSNEADTLRGVRDALTTQGIEVTISDPVALRATFHFARSRRHRLIVTPVRIVTSVLADWWMESPLPARRHVVAIQLFPGVDGVSLHIHGSRWGTDRLVDVLAASEAFSHDLIAIDRSREGTT